MLPAPLIASAFLLQVVVVLAPDTARAQSAFEDDR